MMFFGEARWDEASPTAPDAGPAPSPAPVPLAVGAAVADNAGELAADHSGDGPHGTHGHGMSGRLTSRRGR